MKSQKRTIAMSCISIAMCIVTLFSFSFSWIKRDWSPTVEQEGITITATSALSLILNGQSQNTIKLEEVLGVKDVNLRQISNATGGSGDFFYLESDGQIKNSIIHRVTKSDEEAKDNTFSQKYGYVEFKFMITGKAAGSSVTQKVFLSRSSHLQAPELKIDEKDAEDTVKAAIEKEKKYMAGTEEVTAEKLENARPDDYVAWVKAAYEARYESLLKAIRISITTSGIKEDGDEDTSIYKTIGLIGGNHRENFTHEGLNPDKADGKKLYSNGSIDESLVVSYDTNKDPKARTFQNFYEFVTTGATILEMKPNTIHYITIRVWLEGTDDACTEDIAGLKFDLLLQFESDTAQNTETTTAATETPEVTE